LFPAFHSGEDVAGIGGPDEGFWIGVCLGDEAIDGGFQVECVAKLFSRPK